MAEPANASEEEGGDERAGQETSAGERGRRQSGEPKTPQIPVDLLVRLDRVEQAAQHQRWSFQLLVGFAVVLNGLLIFFGYNEVNKIRAEVKDSVQRWVQQEVETQLPAIAARTAASRKMEVAIRDYGRSVGEGEPVETRSRLMTDIDAYIDTEVYGSQDVRATIRDNQLALMSYLELMIDDVRNSASTLHKRECKSAFWTVYKFLDHADVRKQFVTSLRSRAAAENEPILQSTFNLCLDYLQELTAEEMEGSERQERIDQMYDACGKIRDGWLTEMGCSHSTMRPSATGNPSPTEKSPIP